MVIHFTRAAGHEIGTGTFLDSFLFSSSSPAAATTCQRCGHLPQGREGVVMSCLDCFLHGGSLYLFHYAVSPAFFLAKARGGTCTLAASDPGHVVIHRARSAGSLVAFVREPDMAFVQKKLGELDQKVPHRVLSRRR